MRNLYSILFVLIIRQAVAQGSGGAAFTFLNYPASARVNALGGSNVSLVENDPSLTFHNPALMGAEMSGTVNLNYMNFVSDIHLGSAIYTRALGENGAWGAGAAFVGYGKLRQASAENIVSGEFSAQDLSLNAIYSHNLSERWRGGLAIKLIYSSLESYTSYGLAVDAGLSYYDPEREFSFGLALKNAGAQLKAYYDERQAMPWDVQAGITKRLARSPLRLSLTAVRLNEWSGGFVEHFAGGVDLVLSENFWIGAGFNPKVNADMRLQNGNRLGGFSAGGGIKIKAFDVGISVARYHPSAMSLMLSLSIIP
ncbi:MAG: type IX secretion system protein PorQ [Tannerellaceae bacterium]|jgi:hypothetical protein|nr:type IX secretion system protein PorQ [Tannerellaceae bacterium]